jgi:alpha-amylase
MSKVRFIFGIHNHQPVGNFQSVFEEAFDRSYYPFLQLLESYPKIRTSIHFSGILLKWIEENRPQGIDILRKLVESGQLEVMTGGFYEPILPVIPDHDKEGQIRKLTRYIEKVIGDIPVGMWLAERVWEPHLPRIMKKAGVKYTVLDDAHFRYSGLTDDQLHGYYLTEEQGDTVALFPISRKLRYTIPFRPVEETIEYLRELSGSGDNTLAIYADDGEKFGVWPGTYKSCFTERWLERFFAALSDSSDFIEMIHFREALSKMEPSGRVYLPTASYTEMNEWALPATAIMKYEEFVGKLKQAGFDSEYNVFVRGGFWRNFLAKYPETNNMHKKMLAVSQKIVRAKSGNPDLAPILGEAEDYLWRGQCNCPYWHGVFGGLYLTHIRSAIYQNLIMAEKCVDDATHSQESWIDIKQTDFDRDGKDELLVETPSANYYFMPASGASLFELDYKASNLNIVDTITRRQEGYHDKIKSSRTDDAADGDTVSIHDSFKSKEEGLEKLLSYDWYRRACFIDHFFGEGITPEEFATASYPEEGDFVNQPYTSVHEKVGSDALVKFARDGGVWSGGKHANIRVEKEFVIVGSDARIDVNYILTNNDESAVNLHFGIELNFGFPSLTSPEVSYTIDGKVPARYKRTGTTSSLESISEFGLLDGDDNLRIDFLLQKKSTVWRMPVYSVSLSEDGFEKVQQGICMMPSWKLHLSPGESWKLEIKMRIHEIDPAQAAQVAQVSLARA